MARQFLYKCHFSLLFLEMNVLFSKKYRLSGHGQKGKKLKLFYGCDVKDEALSIFLDFDSLTSRGKLHFPSLKQR